MNLELDESQKLIQSAARDFARNRVAPLAAQIDREAKIPRELLSELGQLGLLGVNIPESLGGTEAGVTAYSLAMIEIAKACASTAVTMSVTNMVGEVIATFGSEEQQKKYCPKICDGSLVAGAFALSETEAGSDPRAMRTTAKPDGDFFVLDGSKQWITSGEFAGVFVVWAQTEVDGKKGISAFLVEAGTPGLIVGHHENKMGLLGSPTNQIHFENCTIPKSALLGQLGSGFKIAMMALDGGRIGIASQAIGIAEAALSKAVDYAKDRKAFGGTISDLQAIQWMIADSRTELDAAIMLTMRAAYLKEANQSFSSQAAMAKLYASESAGRICDRALQIHGGYGYTKDYDVERHYRDVRVTRIYEGTSEIQRLVIARSQLG